MKIQQMAVSNFPPFSGKNRPENACFSVIDLSIYLSTDWLTDWLTDFTKFLTLSEQFGISKHFFSGNPRNFDFRKNRKFELSWGVQQIWPKNLKKNYALKNLVMQSCEYKKKKNNEQ